MEGKNKHIYSSAEAERLAIASMYHITGSGSTALTNLNMDAVRLGNIRLLNHVRGGMTHPERRDRAIHSMENLLKQMQNMPLKQQAQIIIMAAKRT